MKILSLAGILLFIWIVSGIFFWIHQQHYCTIPSSQGQWVMEIARTPEEQLRGLMGRKKLCSRCGMLFVFDKEEPETFWMKDTLIPLDMYFYNSNGGVVDVARNMLPEYETKNPMVYHARSSQYVIEVNSGTPWNILQLPGSCMYR